MQRQYRRFPITLPAPDYEALAALAEREERTLGQQAAYLVRRALEQTSHTPVPASVEQPGLRENASHAA